MNQHSSIHVYFSQRTTALRKSSKLVTNYQLVDQTSDSSIQILSHLCISEPLEYLAVVIQGMDMYVPISACFMTPPLP